MAVPTSERFVLAIQYETGLGVIEILLAVRPVHHAEFFAGVVAVAGEAGRAVYRKNFMMQAAFRLQARIDFEMTRQAFLSARPAAKLVAFYTIGDTFQKCMRRGEIAWRNLRL